MVVKKLKTEITPPLQLVGFVCVRVERVTLLEREDDCGQYATDLCAEGCGQPVDEPAVQRVAMPNGRWRLTFLKKWKKVRR